MVSNGHISSMVGKSHEKPSYAKRKRLRKTEGVLDCLECGGSVIAAIDVRGRADRQTIVRRRVCMDCDHRWTTYEHPTHPNDRMANYVLELFYRIDGKEQAALLTLMQRLVRNDRHDHD